MQMKVETTLNKFAKQIQEDIEKENDDDVCYHGGKSWDTSNSISEYESLIVADVLDSPFRLSRALEVISEQLERCCQESPLLNVKN